MGRGFCFIQGVLVMFQSVNSRVNFPRVEEDVLALWENNNIFEQSVEARRKGPLFMLYEGPPTANGSPGIHHVLARIFKDVIPRYKSMKGYYTPRIAGWDTHGLPVELEVEKELGFSGKSQIEEYGIDKFNARCRESVFRYLKEWEVMTKRIGFWVDLEHSYITMNNSYIESVWWAIKQMWDKGLVYQGYKVTPHCPRCGTSLSSHEVALGYQDDTEDPSVYIKFKLVDNNIAGITLDKPAYFLAWTTTPWTLPGNTALAVSPDAEYSIVEIGGEYLILADALRELVGQCDNRVVEKIEGNQLVNTEYEPLFNPHDNGVDRLRPKSRLDHEVTRMTNIFEAQVAKKDLTYKVIAGDFVSMEDGTGIVHIAPAFGEIDFEVGMHHGLDFVQPVDLQGKMTGTYPFAEKFVKKADPLVLDDLESHSLLFKSERIKHTYPFCWRCGTPLLYYAKQTWYIRTTAVKEELISGNNEINWYPDHIKEGRFGDWLKNNVDWAFSRERYWGTPMPVWRCESCGCLECIGSLDELANKPGFSGFKEPLDLHRPFVDELTFDCPQCGEKMVRAPEVIDCWFDSGAMPVAQWHYPFENDTLLEDGRFPADFICEAVDQTRGWFYSLHAVSTLLFNQPSYKNVICLGHILDVKGDKMSKAKGNVVEPGAVINKYGADALRWYLFTSSSPGNVRRFSGDLVAEVSRRFLSTLWNVYSFFVMYANIDKFTPGSGQDLSSKSELDRWIISELNHLIADVDSALENYDPTGAGRKIDNFVDGLSNWYVRRSRRRFWKSEGDADKLSAYNTLYHCLTTLSKLMAPFTPFLAEALYQNLVCSVFPKAPESVHLADFPVLDKSKVDKKLMEATRLVMKVSSMGRSARSQAGIKVRQPLAEIIISVSGSYEQEHLERLKPQILEELNVKDIKFKEQAEIIELYGQDYEVKDRKSRFNEKRPFVVHTEGVYSVVVPTKITAELLAEGMARELVHRIQTMRRSAGFDVADHIITYYQVGDYIKQIMEDKFLADYIKQETLSQQLVDGVPEEDVSKESFKLSGYEVMLGVKRLS